MKEPPANDPSRPAPEASSAAGLYRIAAIAVIAVAALAILSLGAPVLVPIAEALLVWFIVNSLADSFNRVAWVRNNVSPTLVLWLSALLVVLIGLAVLYSGVQSVAGVGPQALRLQSSLDPLILSVAQLAGIEAASIVDRMLDAIGIETLLREIALGLLGLVNQFGLVAIYVGFLLVDQKFFPAKMRLLFPDAERRASAEGLLSELALQIRQYLWIMSKVSSGTAALSYVVFLAFGLEGALFWAGLVFVLNFIPNIGSIIATIVPTAVALVQFQDVLMALLLCLALSAVQFTLGNIVLPRMTGETLNMSLSATLLSLVVWGALWGVTGMFLAVPMTAILIIVASRFPSTHAIAVCLSKTGRVARPKAPGEEKDRGIAPDSGVR